MYRYSGHTQHKLSSLFREELGNFATVAVASCKEEASTEVGGFHEGAEQGARNGKSCSITRDMGPKLYSRMMEQVLCRVDMDSHFKVTCWDVSLGVGFEGGTVRGKEFIGN
jgi:hypothetical protein